MTPTVLGRLLDSPPLLADEVEATFDELVAPSTPEARRAGILVALAGRSLSAPELARFAASMRRRARPFRIPPRDGAIDLCGSGGAPNPSFNVSTVSAFVVSAAGAAVAKHGNRSARGICGSSDLLEALGLPIATSLAFPRATYRRLRLAFLHAPLYHPATARVASARRALGIPTVFNRLGPLTNPAAVRCQVVGAPDLPTAEIFSRVLSRLGVTRGMSMSSADGCDEFSPRAITTAFVWLGGRVRRLTVDPARHLEADDRRGSWGPLPPPAAAEETERILAGGGGPRRGAVLLTSAAALWIAGVSESWRAGLDRARDALDRGHAAERLEALREVARRFRPEAA